MSGGCVMLSGEGFYCQAEDYSDKPKTVVMQYIVLFSHFTVLLPSHALSQKHDAAVCKPAPAMPNMLKAVHTEYLVQLKGESKKITTYHFSA